jgi:4-hydroxybenzoyl-CoA reductase subunit beta
MLRLPPFRYHRPRSLREAVRVKAQEDAGAAYLAGGTDLLPNMKRRQTEPRLLVAVGHLRGLRGVRRTAGGWLRIGAGEVLADLARNERLAKRWPVLPRVLEQIASPAIRSQATIGGNVCLDTRCDVYDQGYAWRRAAGFCLKKDGEVCQVAPGSSRCWAVQASDTAPVLVALGAELELLGPDGERRITAAEFFRDDGARHLDLRPGELLVAVHLPPRDGCRATYLKIRQRSSIDFPLLGVAVWMRRESPRGRVAALRLVLGGVASRPLEIPEAADALVGSRLEPEAVEAAAEAAWKRVRPLDNAELPLAWRKAVVRPAVRRALETMRTA